MRRLLIAFVLAGALGTAAAALAAGNHPITEKVLGAASVAQPYTFAVQQPADVVVAKATVPPGASFGWHSHRAAVVAIVKSGTLSLYDSADPTCTAHRYSAGAGFTEQPGHVHLARNEGHRPVVVLVTYIGLKHGVNPDVPAAKPGNCPF
jgi:quercetin dioxygenase-like cupin family protein